MEVGDVTEAPDGPDDILTVALKARQELEGDLKSDDVAAVVLRVKTELAVQLRDLGKSANVATGWTSIESRSEGSRAVSEAAASLDGVAMSLDRVADAILTHAEAIEKKPDEA